MRLRKYLGVALLTVGLLALLSGCDFGSQQHTHTFSKWEVTKDPTCVDEGVQSRECRECGYVETEKIDPVGHTTAKTAAVKATCITDGLTEGTHCSVCNEVLLAQETIPAFGHSPLKDYAVEPTCTTDGLTEGSHCGLCGAVIVGTGVPQIGMENDTLRTVYEERFSDGYRYAYMYPGMERVLQAAGRIIRTETDRGALLLIDQRWSDREHLSLLPPHYKPVQIHGISALNERLSAFWNAF